MPADPLPLDPAWQPVLQGAVALVLAALLTLSARIALRRAGLVAPPRGEVDWGRLLSAGLGIVLLLSVLASVLGVDGGVPVGMLAGALAALLPAGVVAAAASVRARRLRERADQVRKSERENLEAEAVLTERAGVVAAVVLAAGSSAIGPVALVCAVLGAVWVLRHPTLRPRLDQALASLQAGRRLRSEHRLRAGSPVTWEGLPHVLLGPVGLTDTRLGPAGGGEGEITLVENTDLEAVLDADHPEPPALPPASPEG